MPTPSSDDIQGQAQLDLSRMLDLQKQLRREIAFARQGRIESQEALSRLAEVNKRIGRLKKSLDKGRLFDEQMEMEF